MVVEMEQVRAAQMKVNHSHQKHVIATHGPEQRHIQVPDQAGITRILAHTSIDSLLPTSWLSTFTKVFATADDSLSKSSRSHEIPSDAHLSMMPGKPGQGSQEQEHFLSMEQENFVLSSMAKKFGVQAGETCPTSVGCHLGCKCGFARACFRHKVVDRWMPVELQVDAMEDISVDVGTCSWSLTSLVMFSLCLIMLGFLCIIGLRVCLQQERALFTSGEVQYDTDVGTKSKPPFDVDSMEDVPPPPKPEFSRR